MGVGVVLVLKEKGIVCLIFVMIGWVMDYGIKNVNDMGFVMVLVVVDII